jgi:integrase
VSKYDLETLLDGLANEPSPPNPSHQPIRIAAAGRAQQAAGDAPANRRSAPGCGTPLTAAVAIQMVERWSGLSPTRRRDLVCALQAVTRMAGMPASNVLLIPQVLRQHVLKMSAAQCGMSRSRLSNVRTLLRYILRRADVIDAANTPISADWSALLDRLDPKQRCGLILFARSCTVRRLTPPMVSSATLEDFLAHAVERTLKPYPRELAARVRKVWNRACASVEGWPQQPLPALSAPARSIKPLAAFPQSFQNDLAAFGARMTATVLDVADDGLQDDDDASVPLIGRKPVRAVTATVRISHARWAASALVESGVPIAEVTSLRSLVTPLTRAKAIFRRLYQEAGDKPSAKGMHVGEVVLMIAKYSVRLPAEEIAQIRAWGEPLKLVYNGMTAKNEARIREASDPSRELRLMELPDVLMRTARPLRATAPHHACFRALAGTAIKLFGRRMLRLANVAGLRLDHLQRANPKRGLITHLHIPAGETKNTRVISQPIAPDIARMLEEWITDFRPIIAAPDCVYLFPGYRTGNRPITPQGLSNAVKKATRNYAGVELSPHQFRHLGAHTFLEEYPGHYEEVRRQLGHASVTTTTQYYCSAESASATRRFDEVILNRRQKLRRKPAVRKPARQPRKPRGEG